MAITLERNAYSPRVLAEELHFIVKPDFIRKQVAAGKIKAQRFGGKHICDPKGGCRSMAGQLALSHGTHQLGRFQGQACEARQEA
jgi:hypothetical protein